MKILSFSQWIIFLRKKIVCETQFDSLVARGMDEFQVAVWRGKRLVGQRF
jgi:hypothetical protein